MELFFISDKDDDDIAGLVFGYQSNRHFYVCSWKRKTQSYNLQANLTYPRSVARRGINLMVVNSSTGPGENLRDALWETGNTMNQTHLLWHDDGPQWIAGVAYHWRLLHDPDSGRIRVRWYRGGKLLSDSGNIINKRYQGGRLGMYVFSQEGVHYSKLYAGSPKISNFAMSFNGSIGGNVDLGVISNLLGGSKSGSITIAAWVWIPGPNGKVTCALPPINFGSSHPDLGFLTQSSDDERNWVLRKLKTPTPKTGPSADHTGSGYYAFLETSGIPIGSRASLETPWFAAGDGCNTTFFYHMNDRSNKTEMGSLAVEVKTVDQTWFMVFRKAGDQGNIWHQGTIDLSAYKGLVAVRFTATKGKSYRSDVALDDIVFSAKCGSAQACINNPDTNPIFGSKEGRSGVQLSVGNTGMLGNLSFAYNTWTHVAFQYNNQTKQQTLYVSGRVAQQKSSVSSLFVSTNLLLGQNGFNHTEGQMDEVQIWNTAVNVSSTFDKYLKGTEEGLVRYFKCNEGEGKLLKDSSASKKHVILQGTNWLSSSLELNKN